MARTRRQRSLDGCPDRRGHSPSARVTKNPQRRANRERSGAGEPSPSRRRSPASGGGGGGRSGVDTRSRRAGRRAVFRDGRARERARERNARRRRRTRSSPPPSAPRRTQRWARHAAEVPRPVVRVPRRRSLARRRRSPIVPRDSLFLLYITRKFEHTPVQRVRSGFVLNFCFCRRDEKTSPISR